MRLLISAAFMALFIPFNAFAACALDEYHVDVFSEYIIKADTELKELKKLESDLEYLFLFDYKFKKRTKSEVDHYINYYTNIKDHLENEFHLLDMARDAYLLAKEDDCLIVELELGQLMQKMFCSYISEEGSCEGGSYEKDSAFKENALDRFLNLAINHEYTDVWTKILRRDKNKAHHIFSDSITEDYFKKMTRKSADDHELAQIMLDENLIDLNEDIPSQDWDRYLIKFVSQLNLLTIEFLIENGADVNHKSTIEGQNITPLDAAISRLKESVDKREYSSQAIAFELTKKLKDANAKASSENETILKELLTITQIKEPAAHDSINSAITIEKFGLHSGGLLTEDINFHYYKIEFQTKVNAFVYTLTEHDLEVNFLNERGEKINSHSRKHGVQDIASVQLDENKVYYMKISNKSNKSKIEYSFTFTAQRARR